MEIVNIEALIAQKRVLSSADIDSANDYLLIGKFQTGSAKYRGADPNAYKPYAVSIANLLSASATPITINVIPKGTGPSITDGTWWFKGNNIVPLNPNSSIGDATSRIATIFMASTIDYSNNLTWFSTGARMTLTTTGDLGIGIVPTQKLDVNGVSLFRDTIMISPNDGYLTFSAGTNVSLMALTGRYLSLRSVDSYIELTTNAIERIKITATGDVAIGNVVPTSRLHVRGVDGTAANYAIKADDDAGNRLLHVRNDGKTFFGQEPVYISSSAILSPGELNLFIDSLLVLDGNLSTVIIEAGSSKPLRFNTWHGGGSGNIVEFAGRGMAGFESYIHTLDADFPLISGFKSYIGSTAAGDDTTFRHCFPFGNVHIGYDEASSAGVTKLTIRGRGTTNATHTLSVQDSTTAVLFHISDDGTIAAAGLQTGNVGLASGDLYVDTAANILANGDLVVARKV